jgi:hypothetical protein
MPWLHCMQWTRVLLRFCWCKLGPKGTNTIVLLLQRGKERRAPSEDYSFFLHYCCCYNYRFYLYYYHVENEERNSNSIPWNSPSFNACPINYNDTPIYMDGGRWQFSPKPLVVIFFRAPGGRGIYKKPLELTQRPTNPYMG